MTRSRGGSYGNGSSSADWRSGSGSGGGGVPLHSALIGSHQPSPVNCYNRGVLNAGEPYRIANPESTTAPLPRQAKRHQIEQWGGEETGVEAGEPGQVEVPGASDGRH